MGGCIGQDAMGNKWVAVYGMLKTIHLYRLGWNFCILAVILLSSGGCLLKFIIISLKQNS